MVCVSVCACVSGVGTISPLPEMTKKLSTDQVSPDERPTFLCFLMISVHLLSTKVDLENKIHSACVRTCVI